MWPLLLTWKLDEWVLEMLFFRQAWMRQALKFGLKSEGRLWIIALKLPGAFGMLKRENIP